MYYKKHSKGTRTWSSHETFWVILDYTHIYLQLLVEDYLMSKGLMFLG